MEENVKKLRLRPVFHEVAAAQVQDKFSDYPSNGLTPERLANIFREADIGDVYRQMELFEEMEEKDPHLFSQLQTRKNAVTGLDYEIIPFSTDDPRDKEIAEFVRDSISGLENLEDVMMDLLDAVGKGFAVSEIIWDYRAGHVVVGDILHRQQKRFFWDHEDRFLARTAEHSEGVPLPAGKFIIHRYKARSGHPSRAGVLRVVAWMYLFKNYDLKDWVSFCEVFGMPLRLGKYTPSASEADKSSLRSALIHLGADAAGIIPTGTEIEFITAEKTSSTDLYERLARYCDEQMSKAILGQTLTSDSGGGSFAQSKTHNEVRHDLTVADCKALAATLRRDLIRPLVLFNFGETQRIPYLRFDCEEAADLVQLSDILGTLTEKLGLKIPTSYIYKKFSIPRPEDGEEVAVPYPTPAVSAPDAPPLALKAPIPTDRQARSDALADSAIRAGGPAFEAAIAPVLALVEGAKSLEDIMAALEDNEQAAKIFQDMNAGQLETLLQKAMLYANLEGRAIENG